MKTLVVQTFRKYDVPIWIQKCMQSIKDWSEYNGYEYKLVGDEFFSLKPSWCSISNKWVITDICRLVMIANYLLEYDRVVYADADFLIFDINFTIHNETHGFAYEYPNMDSLNNSFMFFNKGSKELAFYYDESKKVILSQCEIRTGIRPDLLRQIHSKYKLNILYNLGLMYSSIASQLLYGSSKDLELYISRLKQPLMGVNMCNFTRDLSPTANDILFIDSEFNNVVDLLISTRGERLNRRWAK